MKLINKATVRPASSLNLLSRREIEGVMNTNDEVFQLFRQCALAVLNTGSEQDDAAQVLADYEDFNIRIISESRGIKLEVSNAPASAFVDGRMIRGIQDHLFSALRDIVYTHHKISLGGGRFDLHSEIGITDAVFRILRNAGVVKPNVKPKMVVCWGGHSIKRDEYDYTKHVGYQLGLRDLHIATGCGIGAMKGPMKGAVVGHGKQQIRDGRYVGITEPGIIASESPNPTVNELVILPDIEKRLEAFVRLSHCIIVFPGGAGTAEEVLYLLGLLLHPDNTTVPVPLIFAAPSGSEDYFIALDQFIRNTLGEAASQYYEIIIGQPEKVAQRARDGVELVQRYRRKYQESYAYNWRMSVPQGLQQPFVPSHENMLNLNLSSDLPGYELAAELRRAFSGIVAGNVKAEGIKRVNEHGPYIIRGEKHLLSEMDKLLHGFVAQGRMKLKGKYSPCYRIVT